MPDYESEILKLSGEARHPANPLQRREDAVAGKFEDSRPRVAIPVDVVS